MNIIESNFANSDVLRKNECQADTREYQWKVNYNYVRVHINTFLVVVQTETVTCNMLNKFNVGYFSLLTRNIFCTDFFSREETFRFLKILYPSSEGAYINQEMILYSGLSFLFQ